MSVMNVRNNEVRKVNRMGNSLGIGIPKSIIDTLELKKGDELQFNLDENNRIVLEKKSKLEDRVDPELLEMLAETFEEHDKVFRHLRDR
ncbi:AbrB/MazE/SpoVT family DNA-binding domain-containing protein [Salipaludibacillus sp. CUR1]|uniref:AbrB/MazE/SpoVT family DNA-binding domain-containing protein n=1 Tax=Salipaludibacillus sp. CUR1 TaxID=2820003 RepID=UPI001E2D4203|nr:AbrB/MazE/SpoVT family DNA-binding domain-containing protein [Salipaludibacillus sp. CUR1]MCE7791702.1 AbrB/MazE/SpoVT family DNA-binding domain-containing protein [Salipaludibacillus sp. CUR1]